MEHEHRPPPVEFRTAVTQLLDRYQDVVNNPITMQTSLRIFGIFDDAQKLKDTFSFKEKDGRFFLHAAKQIPGQETLKKKAWCHIDPASYILNMPPQKITSPLDRHLRVSFRATGGLTREERQELTRSTYRVTLFEADLITDGTDGMDNQPKDKNYYTYRIAQIAILPNGGGTTIKLALLQSGYCHNDGINKKLRFSRKHTQQKFGF